MIEIMQIICSDESVMKIEINSWRKNGKTINKWILNNTFSKHQQINKRYYKEIRKYLNTNENGNITYHNLWNGVKAVVRGDL